MATSRYLCPPICLVPRIQSPIVQACLAGWSLPVTRLPWFTDTSDWTSRTASVTSLAKAIDPHDLRLKMSSPIGHATLHVSEHDDWHERHLPSQREAKCASPRFSLVCDRGSNYPYPGGRRTVPYSRPRSFQVAVTSTESLTNPCRSATTSSGRRSWQRRRSESQRLLSRCRHALLRLTHLTRYSVLVVTRARVGNNTGPRQMHQLAVEFRKSLFSAIPWKPLAFSVRILINLPLCSSFCENCF